MITLLQQAEQYRQFAQEKCQVHRALAGRTKRMYRGLGVLVVLFATTGVCIFFSAAMAQKKNALEMAIAGLLLVLTAVLSAILISFRLSAVTERHTKAAASYDAVSYRLGMFLLFYPDLRNADARHFAVKEMNEITGRMTLINLTAPVIPGKIWDKIKDNHPAPVTKEKSIPFASF
jgi:hypothetical protein